MNKKVVGGMYTILGMSNCNLVGPNLAHERTCSIFRKFYNMITYFFSIASSGVCFQSSFCSSIPRKTELADVYSFSFKVTMKSIFADAKAEYSKKKSVIVHHLLARKVQGFIFC